MYLDNLDAINRQFAMQAEGTVVYQHDYIDKLSSNDFMKILLDQKKQKSWTMAVDGH